MKSLILLFTVLTLTASAQTAADFTITDIDANSRNLYSELDANKIVVLKFFTSWCSICNNTADEVVDIYNDHQTAGDPVVFWALNRDQNETNAHATTYRNNHSIPFPVIGEAYPIAQLYGVVYQPEYYIIRPDRSFVQNNSYTAMETAVQAALTSLATGVNELSEQENIVVANNRLSWNSVKNNQGILSLTDLKGRTIREQSLLAGQSIDLNLAEGVYLYSLEINGQKVASGKFPVFL